MINEEKIYKAIKKLKPHTKSAVKENQKKILPVFNTGKMFNTDKYHYLNRWYSYRYSADFPEGNFGIIYVENMPYRSLYGRKCESSFISRMDRMIYNNEIEPFLLFINNRFVPWSCIDIIHDCEDSYLRIHGDKYNYHVIKDVKMLILPYNVNYIDIESDYLFEINYSALKQYIQESARIVNGKLYINLPDYNTDYKYDGVKLNIGAWMYNQLRLRHLGLLSDYKINKLRAVPVEKFETTESGENLNAFNTTVNLFDRDSYNTVIYESLCNLSKEDYDKSAMFKFNDDGLLDNNGNTMICVVDNDDFIIDNYSFEGNENIDIRKSIDSTLLFEDNYIVFKNGMICTDYKIQLDLYNFAKIYDIDKTKDYTEDGKIISSVENNVVSVKVFYNKSIDDIFGNTRVFPNQEYLKHRVAEQTVDGNDIGYINECKELLDFQNSDKLVFEDNYKNDFDYILNYNPLLFNDLYESSIESTVISGEKANESLNMPVGYNNRYGLKIPRMKYEDHETFAMVFVNGDLISSYKDLVIYPNHLFIPLEEEFRFNDDDQIELLYFKDCNNNEINFKYNNDTTIFSKVIPQEDLKLFSTEVSDILIYPDMEYDYENISFPVYDKKDDGSIGVIDNSLLGKTVTAVSSKKFIYQNLVIDQRAYKIRLGKQFRYCDNQKQYVLFINGRRMLDDTFLITIPKVSRPFNAMYIYLTKFVSPDDRVELFYVPKELFNSNTEESITINTNGYIETDNTLDVPFNNESYLLFINGKKIPKDNLINIDTNLLRLNKDTKTLNTLIINPVYNDIIPEVSDFIKENQSLYSKLINKIKDTLGYDELDTLFNSYISISDSEENALVRNVPQIAIINEIVRDFWVTSGYDYNANPFVYDYETDEFIVKDKNGNYILPALDATQNINIIKYGLHLLYFRFMEDQPEYFEIGSVLDNIKLYWEYNSSYGEQKTINSQQLNGMDLNPNIREYIINKSIREDEVYKITAKDNYNTCSSEIHIRFTNGIYYGLVDEDTLDGKESDIYHDHLDKLLHDITRVLQPMVDLDLNKFIIGNNKYFIYAAPKRLVYDENGKIKITFYLPDIHDERIIAANRDDKTTPILTNGKFDQSESLIKLDQYEMELLGEFNYTNSSGYTEDYVVFKSNGFFTRLYDDTEFTINVR